MSRLTIRQTANALGYKSTRSAYRWCRNNGVTVLSDYGSRGKYVLLTEFRLKYLAATISHVKHTYGESHWRNALKAYLNDDILSLLVIKQDTKERNQSQAKKGKHEEKFLTELNTALGSTT